MDAKANSTTYLSRADFLEAIKSARASVHVELIKAQNPAGLTRAINRLEGLPEFLRPLIESFPGNNFHAWCRDFFVAISKNLLNKDGSLQDDYLRALGKDQVNAAFTRLKLSPARKIDAQIYLGLSIVQLITVPIIARCRHGSAEFFKQNAMLGHFVDSIGKLEDPAQNGLGQAIYPRNWFLDIVSPSYKGLMLTAGFFVLTGGAGLYLELATLAVLMLAFGGAVAGSAAYQTHFFDSKPVRAFSQIVANAERQGEKAARAHNDALAAMSL
jgi:hypothetical protein